MYFVFFQLLSSGSVWFAIILMVVTCLFLDIVKKVFDRQLHPTNTEKAQVTLFIYKTFYLGALTVNGCQYNFLTLENRKFDISVLRVLQSKYCYI